MKFSVVQGHIVHKVSDTKFHVHHTHTRHLVNQPVRVLVQALAQAQPQMELLFTMQACVQSHVTQVLKNTVDGVIHQHDQLELSI